MSKINIGVLFTRAAQLIRPDNIENSHQVQLEEQVLSKPGIAIFQGGVITLVRRGISWYMIFNDVYCAKPTHA